MNEMNERLLSDIRKRENPDTTKRFLIYKLNKNTLIIVGRKEERNDDRRK